MNQAPAPHLHPDLPPCRPPALRAGRGVGAIAAAAGLCAALALAPAAAHAARDPAPPQATLEAQAGGISAWRLANGFKIILAPFPAAGTARVELLVKSGSKLEGYGESGMAHLLEHMLFKGAGPRADLKHDLTALGARWNGTTTADRTNYFETMPAEPDKVDEALRIEADRLIRARFTREDLASEMTVVRNELERQDKDPWRAALRSLQRQTYFWHGYGRPTIGARSDIEDAPFAALQAFHRRHYRPDNAALIVSGRIEPDRVLALATRLFAEARNPGEPRPAAWTREEGPAATNRSELVLPAGTTLAASAWKLPGLASRQAQALDLAVAAICDADWGSLRRELVLERRLAARASCDTRVQADYSELVASAAAGPQANAAQLSSELVRHIESAAARGISAEQLERARLEQLNAFERLRSSHEAVASLLSQAEVAGDWRLLFWQHDMVRELTLDEANAALRAWVVAHNRSDVLLRHGDGVPAVVPPAPSPVQELVAGKDWPALAESSDPLPGAWAELARSTVGVELADARGRAVLVQRHTQGDRVWLALGSDWGNAAALAGRQSACAIASRLLAYGGGGLNRDELSARLEAMRARWSLSLDGIQLEAPRQGLPEALDLLLSAWAAPLLPSDEFARIKAAGTADLEAALRNPALLADSQTRLRFDNFPPGHPDKPQPLEQQLAELRALGYSDVQACVADFGGLAQGRLALVGQLTPAEVRALWSRIARLPASRIGYERIVDPAAPRQVDTTPIVVVLPEQPNASVRGTAVLPISMESADYPALRLAVEALGGNAGSRVWRRLRESEGLAYGAGARLANDTREPRSTLVVYASAASDKAAVALASLQDEIARALKDGFSTAEIERARQVWQEARRRALSAEESYAAQLAQGLDDGRDPAWQAEYDRRMAAVTAQQATEALRRYLGAAPVVWATGRGS
ncbi:MAG: hypothetical protein RJA36_573 [Pseudomonadota bacterium]|jgi:zinc protease